MSEWQVIIANHIGLESQLIQKELASIPDVHCLILEPEVLPHLEFKPGTCLIIDHAALTDAETVLWLALQSGNLHVVLHNLDDNHLSLEYYQWQCLKGTLSKDAPVEHLRSCVTTILNGGMWLPRLGLESILYHYRQPSNAHGAWKLNLTKREKQILDRITAGESNKEIADDLFLAVSTVKTHVYKLYKKMEVNNRHQAISKVRSAARANIKML
ncbi:helix-turn-helix transcriptional regulator [Vibrio ulleungensis]|uniref:Response regulator transcription factor n=1 Tax=Vibrio ulleungensis TaxID=2807619 RepID=A0ABS2HLS6_9VIBR|nr:response regulator transcription factor [Vibrio ulleungensis]MBM7038445.1 response regulator transcription factor [Vibrio ulleungensis]